MYGSCMVHVHCICSDWYSSICLLCTLKYSKYFSFLSNQLKVFDNKITRHANKLNTHYNIDDEDDYATIVAHFIEYEDYNEIQSAEIYRTWMIIV